MKRVLALSLVAGCVVPLDVKQQHVRTEQILVNAHQVYAPLCAPRELARAQANLDFSRIELSRGDVRRAADHLAVAEESAALGYRHPMRAGSSPLYLRIQSRVLESGIEIARFVRSQLRN